MIPQNRITTHPGTILLKEYLEPMELTQKNWLTIWVFPYNGLMKLSEGKEVFLRIQLGCYQKR